VDRQGELDDVDRLSDIFDPYTILAGLAFATYLGVLVYLAAVPPASDNSNMYKTTRTLPMALNKGPDGLNQLPSIPGDRPVKGTLNDLKVQHPPLGTGQMVLVGKLVDWNSLQQGLAGHNGAILLPVGAGSKSRRRRSGIRG
jgi:hypothetical protein